ncbi:MAG: hypothetical protein ACOCZK_08415 [Planctomycetota bacterium]
MDLTDDKLAALIQELHGLLDAVNTQDPAEFVTRRHLVELAKDVAAELNRYVNGQDSRGSDRRRAIEALVHGRAGHVDAGVADTVSEATRGEA